MDNIYHAKTDEITIFPIGSRSPEKRRLTESNIRLIIKALSDKQSFVTSSSFDMNTKLVEFVIEGYFVSAVIPQSILELEEKTNIYAYIQLNDSGSFVSGGDNDNDEYEGVYFSTNIPTTNETNYLYLLSYVDGKWEIPPESRRRFNSESLSQNFEIVVDGGNVG